VVVLGLRGAEGRSTAGCAVRVVRAQLDVELATGGGIAVAAELSSEAVLDGVGMWIRP